MRILIIGATGMLGNTLFRHFSRLDRFETWGTIRSESGKRHFSAQTHPHLIPYVDVDNFDTVVAAFSASRPDVVINAVGLVKQLSTSKSPLNAIPLNALFPHRVANLCAATSARLIHISTDCVFSGSRGDYRESDTPDAKDLYGLSKLLGEVDYPNAITLRTSIVGHELNSANGLVEWFLSQQGSVRGFTKAIFSGFPTFEIARIISEYLIDRPDLHGLYHAASNPISKHDLLKLVGDAYGKEITIEPDDSLKIDRSLNAERFNFATGYIPPSWPELVASMKNFEQTDRNA